MPRRLGREVRLSSLDFPGASRFSLDDVPGRQADDWGNFPRGAALGLARTRTASTRASSASTAGKLHGGGVSSSAAVGVAFLLAFEDVNGLRVSAEENIELDRRIENDYLGLRNGILDQAAILLSRRGPPDADRLPDLAGTSRSPPRPACRRSRSCWPSRG